MLLFYGNCFYQWLSCHHPSKFYVVCKSHKSSKIIIFRFQGTFVETFPMPYRDEIKGVSKASGINLGKLQIIAITAFWPDIFHFLYILLWESFLFESVIFCRWLNDVGYLLLYFHCVVPQVKYFFTILPTKYLHIARPLLHSHQMVCSCFFKAASTVCCRIYSVVNTWFLQVTYILSFIAVQQTDIHELWNLRLYASLPWF